MNRLSVERQGQVIGCLVEGMSIRATVRVTGVAKNTVTKLLVDLGQACSEYQDAVLTKPHDPPGRVRRDLELHRRQAEARRSREAPDDYGDVWTWTAIDADSKLMVSWLVGERTMADAYHFLSDVKSRLGHRVQMTTDGHKPYLTVVEPLFGADGIDFAMLHKLYGADSRDTEARYSPAVCTAIDKRVICGEAEEALISTSYVERANLTMRMGMRRFTRLTNTFSKRMENHVHAVSLHFMHYNFGRPHQTLTKRYGKPTTPAMAAGVADHPWSVWEIAQLLQAPKSN